MGRTQLLLAAAPANSGQRTVVGGRSNLRFYVSNRSNCSLAAGDFGTASRSSQPSLLTSSGMMP